jgi:predicted SAM-dependent methyltransferase
MGIKINLGSGLKRYEGFVNVDDDPLVEPDYLVNLDDVNIRLPFEDNSVEEIKAHHILEHIGSGFIPLMKELYRVCKHGAILDIEAPHHQHDVFYGDPTHQRPITVPAMNMFSKKINRDHIKTYGSSTGMGLKYDIDFEMVWYDFEYDHFYLPMIEQFNQRKSEGKISPEEDFMFIRLMREATNVAVNTKIKMVAIKE